MPDEQKEKIGARLKAFVRRSGLSQAESGQAQGNASVTPWMPELLRRTAAEGAVLLKNDGMLPLAGGTQLSLFGRVQRDWFYTGYGSGGDVKKPYAVNLLEGIRRCKGLALNEELARVYEAWCAAHPVQHGTWGHWPRFYPEMPVSKELVHQAAEHSQSAVVVIGRSSGEDRETRWKKAASI